MKFFFDQIPFFAISEMAKIQFLKWEKSFKLSKIQFHQDFFYLFDFMSLFAWTLLNFLAHCGKSRAHIK